MGARYEKKVQKPAALLPVDIAGKIPPQAVDLEEAVLGALMLEREAIEEIYNDLVPEAFYKDAHQKIYQAILNLYNRNEGIDIITVSNELRDMDVLEEVGGPYYVSVLSSKVASASHIKFHALVIKDKYFKRQLIAKSHELYTMAFDDSIDSDSLIDNFQNGVEKAIQDYFGASAMKTFPQLLDQSKEDYLVREALAKENKMSGVPTPLVDLTKITGGWQSGDLIVIAGRPSMGKTSVSLSILNTSAKAGYNTAMFSLEMPGSRLTDRMLCGIAQIDSEKFKKGLLNQFEKQKLDQVIIQLRELGIYIDDNAIQSANYIRNKSKIIKQKFGLNMIIIDYMQLIDTAGNYGRSRENEVAQISKSLKSLAKELDVPVIILAQLNRNAELRGGDRRPIISDLRESGCLSGDTLITLASGERVEIKNLVGKQPILAGMDNLTLTIKRANKVWSTGIKKVYEITTATKRKIKATANHPFKKLNNWERLDNLKKGDRIVLPRTVKRIKSEFPKSWSDDKLIIIGHLIGDGSFTESLKYTSGSEINISILEKALLNEFKTVQCNKYKKNNHYEVSLTANANKWHPNPLKVWLQDIGLYGHNFYSKFIPEDIFKMNNDKIAIFIRNLWSTDGCIQMYKEKSGKTNISFYYSTSSKRLCNELQYLLTFFGIQARICQTLKEGTQINYQIHVSGKDPIMSYLSQIGVTEDSINEATAIINYFNSIKSNTNRDTIPKEIFSYVKNQMKSQNISGRKMAELRGTAYGGTSHFKFDPSRDVLKSYAEILNDQYLMDLSESDIFWDEIIEIKECGEEEVFDIEVPDIHNFVANGILVHNSIEQDADLVLLLYRAARYGILEDENGNSTKNVGEIILAKNRNGSCDTIKFGHDDALTRIFDYIDPQNMSSTSSTYEEKISGIENSFLDPNTDFDNSDKPF